MIDDFEIWNMHVSYRETDELICKPVCVIDTIPDLPASGAQETTAANPEWPCCRQYDTPEDIDGHA